MFWKKKSFENTLELLVKKFSEFVEEFKNQNKEEEAKVQNPEAKITIHYQPDVELSVFVDGVKIFSEDKSRGQFDRLVELRRNKDVEGIYNLLLPKKEQPLGEQEEEIKETIENVHYLVSTGDFEVRGDSVYAVGIDRSLPKLLMDKFTQLHIEDKLEEYETLKKFWYWCVLNPIPQVCDKLYNYLSQFDYKLNKDGFIYALRNVNKLTEEKDVNLVQAISENWFKIKGWRKSPKNYNLFKVSNDAIKWEYIIGSSTADPKVQNWNTQELVGNLQELYDKLPEMEENLFTDAHSGKFRIKIGEKVSMDPKKCDWESVNCGSRGLHGTLNLDYYMCGDTSILMLVNPAKVVGIGPDKFRCYEYLPLCVTNHHEISKLMNSGEFDTTEIENRYYEEEVNSLEQVAKEEHVKEEERYNLIERNGQSLVTKEEVNTIVGNLSSRIKQIS